MKRRDFIRCSALAFIGTLPLSRAYAAVRLSFDEMYEGNAILGLTFSEKLQAADDKTVSIDGFMAPPLKANASFFVLTDQPVSLCPFCNSDQDWPANIVVVELIKKDDFVQANKPIRVTGRLSLGSRTDPETGFVSLVRLSEATFEVL